MGISSIRMFVEKFNLIFLVVMTIGILSVKARYDECWPNGSICARGLDCCTGDCQKSSGNIIGKCVPRTVRISEETLLSLILSLRKMNNRDQEWLEMKNVEKNSEQEKDDHEDEDHEDEDHDHSKHDHDHDHLFNYHHRHHYYDHLHEHL